MQFYTLDSKKLDSLISGDEVEDILGSLHDNAASVFEDDSLTYCMEAYSGIADDHEVDFAEFTEHPAAQALSELDGGDGAWFAFSDEDARALLPKLRDITISDEDAENYFGDEDLEEHAGNLRRTHKTFQKQVAAIRPGQVGILRVEP